MAVKFEYPSVKRAGLMTNKGADGWTGEGGEDGSLTGNEKEEGKKKKEEEGEGEKGKTTRRVESDVVVT